MSNVQILGERIRYYRTLRGLTQKEMAAKLGVSPRYIGHIEQGYRGMSLDMQVEMCRFFGVGMSDLLPVESPDIPEDKERMIGEINVKLRALEPAQVGFVNTVVCSLGN